jgi:hypothetical protein
MRLNTLHAKLTTAQRRELAEQVGVTETYLWQIATRWRGKRASLGLIERLALADKRLKRADMLAEFTEPAPVAAS